VCSGVTKVTPEFEARNSLAIVSGLTRCRPPARRARRKYECESQGKVCGVHRAHARATRVAESSAYVVPTLIVVQALCEESGSLGLSPVMQEKAREVNLHAIPF